jgi:ribosomal protein S3AE
MTRLTYAIRKRPDRSDAEFNRYWKDGHDPFVATLAATVRARQHVQSHRIDTPMEDFMAGNGSPEGLAAGAQFVRDEANVVDHANSMSFVTVEHEVFDRTPA